MIVKILEIRDRATYIPAAAMKMVAGYRDRRSMSYDIDAFARRRLYESVGFTDGAGIILMRLNDQEAHSNPYGWKDVRTMPIAHQWIEQHFDELLDCQIVDVEVILGEK